jgi:hypothetical protein
MEERRGFVVWQSVVANPLTTNTSALANWNLARSIHGIASAISGWTFGQWSIYIQRLMRKAAPSVADFARPTFMDKAVYVLEPESPGSPFISAQTRDFRQHRFHGLVGFLSLYVER